MVDTTHAHDGRQGLFSRLRDGVAGLRRPPAGENDNVAIVSVRDRSGRTRLNGKLTDAARRGWEASAATNVSLSVLAIRIDRFAELHGAYERSRIEKARKQIGAAIAGCLKQTGAVGVGEGDDGYVVIMENYPFLMARAQAFKIIAAVAELELAHKESHAGVMTVSVGVATVNPRDGFDTEVVEAALEGLARAQRRGLGRVETRDLRPSQPRRKRA